MLNRSLNAYKWFSLVLLMIGVACVQLPTDAGSNVSSEHTFSDRMIGLVAVIAACFTSGFSGVYMEKILKQSPVSTWIRNFELAFFSIFGGLFMVAVYDWSVVYDGGFLQGYNFLTWGVVFQQAWSGLVIAFVMKYADNILKGFAASISIILSSVVSYLILGDLHLTTLFLVGTTTVIGSVFLYNIDFNSRTSSKTANPPKHTAVNSV